jgi:hypothetical protein
MHHQRYGETLEYLGPVKATEQSVSDWCFTYVQSHAIFKCNEDHHPPMFSDGNTEAASRAHSLKKNGTYSSQDA